MTTPTKELLKELGRRQDHHSRGTLSVENSPQGGNCRVWGCVGEGEELGPWTDRVKLFEYYMYVTWNAPYESDNLEKEEENNILTYDEKGMSNSKA